MHGCHHAVASSPLTSGCPASEYGKGGGPRRAHATMSNHPLPYSTTLLGYSLSSINDVRQQQGFSVPQGPAQSPAVWKQRLGEVRATFQAMGATGGVQGVAQEAVGGSNLDTKISARRSTTQLDVLNWQARQAGALRQPSKYDIRENSPSTSSTCLSSSKLRASSNPVTITVDFAAIARSSVGGNGIARPACQFVACRAGDGLAVYERYPVRSRALRTAPTGQASSAQIPSPSQEASQGPEHKQGGLAADPGPDRSELSLVPKTVACPPADAPSREPSCSPLGSPTRNARPVGSRPGMRLADWMKTSQPDNSWTFERPAFTRPNTTGTLHVPGSSSWTPPAATFLGCVPKVPSSLRVDCGLSTERSFLTTERFDKQPGQADGLGASAASSASAVFKSPYGNVFGSPACSPPRSPVLRAAGVDPDQMLRQHLEGRPELREQDKELIDRAGLTSSQAARVVQGRSHIILEALKAASRPASVKSEAFSFATDQRRIKQLPPEFSLPRRRSPGVGK